MTEEREGQRKSISLGCITPSALGLAADEPAIGDIDLAGIESALPVWEGIVDTIMCDPKDVKEHQFLVLQIMRDTRQLRCAVAHLRSDGVHVPVQVEFSQELTADNVELAIGCLASDEIPHKTKAIIVLTKLLREIVELEVVEAGPWDEDSEEDEFDSVVEFASAPASRKMMVLVLALTAKVRALEEANADKRIGYLEGSRNAPQFLFDKLDKRLAIVEGAIASRAGNGPSNDQVPEVETPAANG